MAAVLDLQPILRDPLVTLRPLVPGDWDALFDAASDPLIWAGHPALDRWQAAVFRSFFDAALASGGALAVLDPQGAVIGSSRYDYGRAEPGEIEIGWTFLARAHWGGAVNRAMKRLMVGHALTVVERVIFLVGDSNVRSQRALAKIGARLTERRDRAEMAGREVVHLVYAIDREAFAAGLAAAVLPGSADEARA